MVNITEETMMAGLSCGEVSKIAWQLLQNSLSHCVSITDDAVAPLMRLLKNGLDSTGPLEAGECSTSGVATMLATKGNPEALASLGLNSDSTVLLFGTEGATSPEIYAKLTETTEETSKSGLHIGVELGGTGCKIAVYREGEP